ncbi:MAG: hypothetical protein R3B49_03295 [Phycisphaerales bacterium]
MTLPHSGLRKVSDQDGDAFWSTKYSIADGCHRSVVDVGVAGEVEKSRD